MSLQIKTWEILQIFKKYIIHKFPDLHFENKTSKCYASNWTIYYTHHRHMDILHCVLQIIIHTTLLIEWFITKTSLAWMFYTMYTLMYIQKTLLPEWLVTYNSCIWTFSAMYAIMSLHISLLPEGLIIHTTPIQIIFTKYTNGAPSDYPVQWMISYKHHTHTHIWMFYTIFEFPSDYAAPSMIYYNITCL